MRMLDFLTISIGDNWLSQLLPAVITNKNASHGLASSNKIAAPEGAATVAYFPYLSYRSNTPLARSTIRSSISSRYFRFDAGESDGCC